MTLVALYALPLARAPLGLLKGEILAFQRMETLRMSELALATTLAKLYKNEILWEQIAKSDSPITLFQENVSTVMEGVGQRAFHETCYLQTIKQKEGKNGEDLGLLNITVSFETMDKKSLWLRLEKEKKKKKKNEEEEEYKMSYFYEVFVSKIPDQIVPL